MVQDFSFLNWLFILIQPALGLLLFFLQYQRIKHLNREKSELLDKLSLSEQLSMHLAYPSVAGNKQPKEELAERNSPIDFLWNQLEDTGLLLVLVGSDGRILRYNNSASQILALDGTEKSPMLISDVCSRRNIQIALIFQRKLRSGSAKRPPTVSVQNRFGETHLVELISLGQSESETYLVVSRNLPHTQIADFSRAGFVLEALMFRSSAPVIVLEKTGRYGGWRSSRILWISAAAARLFGIDALKAVGMPPDFLDSGLLPLLTQTGLTENASGSSARFLHSGKEYTTVAVADSNHLMFQLFPVRTHDSIQLASVDYTTTDSKVSFAKLMEITGGDSDFLHTLLPAYMSSLSESRVEFRKSVELRNVKKLKFLQHKMRATIRTFGLDKLEELFHKALVIAEQQDGNGDTSKILADFNAICQETESVLREFAIRNGVRL